MQPITDDEEVESGDVIIHAPQMPQARFKKAQKVTISVPDMESSEDEGPVSPAPVKRLPAPPLEKKGLKKALLPRAGGGTAKVAKVQSEASSSAGHGAPSAPHKSLPTHYCNCPSCPTKNK
jgi:hypothetical protein